MTDKKQHREIFGPSSCIRMEVLQQYREGALSPKEMQKVEAHLIDCAFCSEALEGLEAAPDQLGIAGAVGELNEMIEAKTGYRPPKATMINLRVVSMAAAVVVLLIGSFFIYKGILDKTSGDRIAQQREADKQDANGSSAKVEEFLKNEQEDVTAVQDSLGKMDAGTVSIDIPEVSAPEERKEMVAESEEEGRTEEKTMSGVGMNESIAEETRAEPPPVEEPETALFDMTEEDTESKDTAPATQPETASREPAKETYATSGKKTKATEQPSLAEVEVIQDKDTDEEKIFSVVEETPEFPGGEQKMVEFIKDKLQYPEDAREKGVEGTVIVGFVVDQKGNLKHVRILKGVSSSVDAEAKRVVQSMPRWKPGKVGGKKVSTRYNLPIRFKR